jgi:hypothetical protein
MSAARCSTFPRKTAGAYCFAHESICQQYGSPRVLHEEFLDASPFACEAIGSLRTRLPTIHLLDPFHPLPEDRFRAPPVAMLLTMVGNENNRLGEKR